ncbi:hypothetical protein L227DRAFT_628076 [Lentinus tigrinus ALCF2SS1-6]|uniref:Uncharacterized protein n=1 Tax=Lentinus tigrinus ALCF2SS1-6 TaxID=1328759 RepID=A0A5C2S8J8_9APHY|nr:hypothetical protein L227DRAFT_628076 [Lentinus tigrinus ALCF2SS1-6]
MRNKPSAQATGSRGTRPVMPTTSLDAHLPSSDLAALASVSLSSELAHTFRMRIVYLSRGKNPLAPDWCEYYEADRLRADRRPQPPCSAPSRRGRYDR